MNDNTTSNFADVMANWTLVSSDAHLAGALLGVLQQLAKGAGYLQKLLGLL